jgi:hypothetical protein
MPATTLRTAGVHAVSYSIEIVILDRVFDICFIVGTSDSWGNILLYTSSGADIGHKDFDPFYIKSKDLALTSVRNCRTQGHRDVYPTWEGVDWTVGSGSGRPADWQHNSYLPNIWKGKGSPKKDHRP